jgi:hypothetical protein
MSAAPHPYRHDDRPAKYVVRYWPVPGQLASSLMGLAILVGVTAWTTTRAVRAVSHRLSCVRAAETVDCTLYEERPWREPKVLWVREGITGVMKTPPADEASVYVTVNNYDPADDTQRFATLPVADADTAARLREFLDQREERTFEDVTGPGALATYAPVVFGLWCLLALARLPRPVVFTVDAERSTLTARFGSLLVRHTTVMPLASIDRVEVILTTVDTRRLQVVKKDGVVEIFDEKYRPGLHHHATADLLWTAVVRARGDAA